MKFNKIIFSSLFVLGIVSCSKQLELEPPNAITTSVALSDIASLQGALNSAYGGMRSASYYGRNMWVVPDISGDDIYVASANSNRFISSYQRVYTLGDGDITGIWNQAYALILRVNNILDNVDKVPGDAATKNSIKGQALFLRALFHFDLTRIFCKPWQQGAGTQFGVPYMTKFDVGNPSRPTLATNYASLISDLTSAKSLLASTTIATKNTASRFAASALLQRIYLYQGKNQEAIDEASAFTGAGFIVTPATALSTFYGAARFNNEEIFTLEFITADNLGADNLGGIYLKPGYGDLRVSQDLVNVFASSDARRNTLIASFGAASPTELVNRKFVATASVNLMHSPKLLRFSEVLLNRAEANAKLGNVTPTIADLNTIRTNRGLPSLTTLPASELLDSVLVEKRREFMFEGHRWFDLIRNNRSVIRTFVNNSFTVTSPWTTLSPTDFRTVAPIPQREIDVNPNIRAQQNDGY